MTEERKTSAQRVNRQVAFRLKPRMYTNAREGGEELPANHSNEREYQQ